ncbi:hypothetical protein [Nonomuraea sp. NPDC048916]|uniref:hypothetical protein n=1 Tax=Nonomuraea sp. NPDC048916 TaxID=3154232 RepID=UPI0033CD9281
MSEMDVRGDDGPFDERGLSVEAPEDDAAEQLREAGEGDEPRWRLPLEADPADTADQERVVELDDDDYR